ncbi:MAG: fructose-bisphosphatase class II family protein, partial [Chloroflexota bacterium]|nr:fructose-bisphosphatase class II family protein [Chloroflexota bacterium]
GATTHSLVMRAVTGTVRYIHSTHRLEKLQAIRHMPFD